MPTFSKRFLFVGLCWLVATNTSAQQYTLTILETSANDYTSAWAINASGQAVGTFRAADLHYHPFVWEAGVMRDLGLLTGYDNCYGTSINDVSQVVGSCDRTVNGRDIRQAFIWTAGDGLRVLPTPEDAAPVAINNAGDVVGFVFGSTYRAFVYRGGVTTDLGPGQANGINDRGQIVGEAPGLLARLWDESGGHYLETFPGTSGSGRAMAISPGGTAVGELSESDNRVVAVAWTANGIANLGGLGGILAEARGVHSGIVVGTASPAFGGAHAFVYDLNGPGTMVDLNDQIPPNAGIVLLDADGVNAAGWIVGNGRVNGQLRGLVLTPRTGPPTTSTNLLVNGGFEEYTPPQLGPPGWVSDDFRQVAAKSESIQARSGGKNGACWTTDNLDCGIFQDLTAPSTGTYTLTIYANADRPGALVGANVGDHTVVSADVAVRGFANYGNAYVLTFTASQGQTIRVWGYSPAVPGYLVIDDVALTGPSS
jgi:probable HAF family extracellular repeat protein